ncbi:MAG: ribosomal L7Ae/L30e/S12e/Gadd45 family protein [Syntrophomonas sp.]
MPLTEIKDSPKLIGTKQVKKALNKGLVKKVFLASDAEPHIIQPIEQLCHHCGVQVVMVDSMKALGHACGIEVGSAAVAILFD